jgi:hypothetical protein
MSSDPLDDYREELIGYLKEIYDFKDEYQDTKEIIMKIAAFSARARWLRSVIIKSPLQKDIRFRIDILDPFLEETQEQFKMWSRIASIAQFEWEQSKR